MDFINFMINAALVIIFVAMNVAKNIPSL